MDVTSLIYAYPCMRMTLMDLMECIYKLKGNEGNYLTNRAISTTARQQATTTTTGMYPFLPCPDPDTELMRVVCFCCSSLFLRDPVTCDICGITYGAKDTAVNATGSTAGCTMIAFLVERVFTFHSFTQKTRCYSSGSR